MKGRIAVPLLVLSCALLASGCMLRDLRDQVTMIDQVCGLEGRIVRGENQGQAVVIVLSAGDPDRSEPPRVVDYTLTESGGDFSFALAPGDYRVLAFIDSDSDLELDDGEPAGRPESDGALACTPGGRIQAGPIEIGTGRAGMAGRNLAISDSRNLVESAMSSAVSLGQLTAFGEVVPLGDARFDPERARDSLWRPVDFLRAGHAGVYFDEPIDNDRTPVLFIHGINGSPRVLEPMIRHIDGDRFQAMYYYYPSGLRIEQLAWHLDRIMREIEHRHGMRRYHVVAHSMGGLVARSWLLQRSGAGRRAEVASFVSLSTPWLGYPSAQQGVEHSPVVVPVWRDMASGSDFLDRMFEAGNESDRLPPHHLLFSFRQSGWISGASGDGVAALATMLPASVQRRAASVFGVDSGHVEILSDPTAQARVEALLRGHTPEDEGAHARPDSAR